MRRSTVSFATWLARELKERISICPKTFQPRLGRGFQNFVLGEAALILEATDKPLQEQFKQKTAISDGHELEICSLDLRLTLSTPIDCRRDHRARLFEFAANPAFLQSI